MDSYLKQDRTTSRPISSYLSLFEERCDELQARNNKKLKKVLAAITPFRCLLEFLSEEECNDPVIARFNFLVAEQQEAEGKALEQRTSFSELMKEEMVSE